ncbi:MAG: beta-propeller fold lactonase family protein [Bryobacteraceae bacterium]
MAKHIWHGLALIAVVTLPAQAQPGGCNASHALPAATIELSTRPFAVAPSRDGCWVFVSAQGGAFNQAGIAVLKRAEGRLELSRMLPLKAPAGLGMVLTHDGKLLIVAASDAVVFLDVRQAISGVANPVLGSFSDGSGAGSIYANVTADDKLLFVSDEGRRSITVIDLEGARSNGYKAGAIVGKIPVGNAPIALTFSPDGKWLYTTSEGALPDWNWPKACKPEGRDPATATIANPEGAVIVVDVARAKTDPSHSVVARIPAGCSPVRMAISPGGDRIYVTARNSNAVLAFDTAKLVSDPEHARVGMAPVGSAPVPIAVFDDGRKVLAGNSNRFAGSTEPQTLTVLDAAKIQEGAEATLGTIPAGAFPREMAVSSDGRTLFVTNFSSQSLQVIDLDHLPMAPHRQQ